MEEKTNIDLWITAAWAKFAIFENRIFLKRDAAKWIFFLTDFVFFHGFSTTKNSGIHQHPPSHRPPPHQHPPLPLIWFSGWWGCYSACVNYTRRENRKEKLRHMKQSSIISLEQGATTCEWLTRTESFLQFFLNVPWANNPDGHISSYANLIVLCFLLSHEWDPLLTWWEAPADSLSSFFITRIMRTVRVPAV